MSSRRPCGTPSTDPTPTPTPLAARHAGPAVARAEHLRELVHPLEVLALVARLACQEADVNEREHDAPQVLGARDAPGRQDGRREQPELLEREVATGPGELRARQVASRWQLRLGVLGRGEAEQGSTLLRAPILPAQALDCLL